MPKKNPARPAVPLADITGLEGYLARFAPALARRLVDAHEPLYDPQTESPHPSLATLLRPPYRAQADTITALARALGRHRGLFLVGELGVGKTLMAAGVIRTVVLTEAATAAGIVGVVVAPLPVAVAVLLPFGVALNGTSSVLYGTVADLVMPERRSRAYGLYYTLAMGSSALAPSVYGLSSDALGVPATLTLIAAIALVTIPLCFALRPAVAVPAGA